MSPMDRRRYHPDWPWIVRQIRAQAGDRCEFCGVPNHTWVQRNVIGDWQLDEELQQWNSTEAWIWLGTDDPPDPVWIVLTVAHVADRDPMNVDPSNLRALCQRCHLNHDRPENQRRAIETRKRNHECKRREAIAATGQLALEGTL